MRRRGHGATAIFLDRDGTLNRKAPEGQYIRRPEDLELLPNAAAAVRRVNLSGMLAVLITNQRWLSEPTVHADAYHAVDSRLRQSLAAHDAWLDACYVCPHAMNACGCRKPAPGMLLRAAEDLKIDLCSSFVIGDSITDVQTGLAVGARTSLIDPAGNSGRSSGAHFVASSVDQAVNWVLDEAAGLPMSAHRP